MRFRPPGYCPNCGEHVEADSIACESCGSCSATGWSEDSSYDGLDLPEEELESARSAQGLDVLKALLVVGLLALVVYVFVFM